MSTVTVHAIYSPDGHESDHASLAEARRFQRDDETIVTYTYAVAPPEDFHREHNGHAPHTYVTDPDETGVAIVFAVYPRHHCETGSDHVTYYVGEDGVDTWYVGPNYVEAYAIAESGRKPYREI